MKRRRSRAERTGMISTDTKANVTPSVALPEERTARSFRDPRTAALACLGVYLLATGALLLASGGLALGLVHLAGAAVVWRAMTQPAGWSGTAGDFLPLIVPPLLYREIPQLIAAGGASFHDPAIQRAEQGLFGAQPSHVLASHFPFPWLSELLHAGYLAYYLVLFVPPLLLYVRGNGKGYARVVAVSAITQLVCWTIFVIAPVAGPRYLWSAPPGIPDGPVRELALSILAAGSSRGAAFPSSHIAVSLAIALEVRRWSPRMAVPLFVVAGLISVGAVYAGFHYGMDMIAGIVVGGVIWAALTRATIKH
jgi:membrane-associated phospholipid phosphatase